QAHQLLNFLRRNGTPISPMSQTSDDLPLTSRLMMTVQIPADVDFLEALSRRPLRLRIRATDFQVANTCGVRLHLLCSLRLELLPQFFHPLGRRYGRRLELR